MEKEPLFAHIDDALWEQLARYLAGESSPAESARVREWLAAEPGRAEQIAALAAAFRSLPTQRDADVDVEAALSSVKSRMMVHSTPVAWRSHLLKAAAAVAVVLGASLIWRASTSETPVQTTPQLAATEKVFETVAGQTDTVSLEDGTTVVLGPASRLVLAAQYGAGARNVELEGEALFNVTHDATRPFSVHAGDATIRDIGTTFAVRSQPGEPVRVTVTEGAVVVHRTGTAEATGMVLHAGERGDLIKGRVAVQREQPTNLDVAFAQGQLVFNNATLDYVATELRRWYGVELRFDDGAMTRRRIDATFRGDSLEHVLRVLESKLGVTIEQHGNTAFVHTDQ